MVDGSLLLANCPVVNKVFSLFVYH